MHLNKFPPTRLNNILTPRTCIPRPTLTLQATTADNICYGSAIPQESHATGQPPPAQYLSGGGAPPAYPG